MRPRRQRDVYMHVSPVVAAVNDLLVEIGVDVGCEFAVVEASGKAVFYDMIEDFGRGDAEYLFRRMRNRVDDARHKGWGFSLDRFPRPLHRFLLGILVSEVREENDDRTASEQHAADQAGDYLPTRPPRDHHHGKANHSSHERQKDELCFVKTLERGLHDEPIVASKVPIQRNFIFLSYSEIQDVSKVDCMGSSATNSNARSKHRRQTLLVHPGMLEKLDLGEFSSESDIPEYQFDLLPDLHDAMGIHQTRVETETGIRVVYHFQNYGMQTIAVYPRKKIGSR